MKERSYYVSWVDKQTDPFPQHQLLPEAGEARLGERRARLLPADHPEWPGIPLLELSDDGVVPHPSIGRFRWPGLNYDDGTYRGRLYLGPTLAALFHPKSDYRDLGGLERVYLLERAGDPGVASERLVRLCRQILRARGREDEEDRIQLVTL